MTRVKIKITYFGPIRHLVGLEEEWVEINSKPIVKEILTYLSTKHGKLFSSMFSDGGSHSSNINIFINGIHILEFEEGSAAIHDGSEVNVVLVSQAAGG